MTRPGPNRLAFAHGPASIVEISALDKRDVLEVDAIHFDCEARAFGLPQLMDADLSANPILGIEDAGALNRLAIRIKNDKV